MNTKLVQASAIALFSLSGFLLFMIVLITFAAGSDQISLGYTLGSIIVLNAIMWLVAPWLQDLMQRWFYKMSRVNYETFEQRAPKTIALIRTMSKQYGIKLPRLGIINDKNPTAFTYGSGPWNGRIIISEGMFEYCNDDEIAAVMAHEFGHIKHWDIAIMTLATTIIQILYALYVFSRKMARKKSGKKGNPFGLIAIAAYIFYIVGQYVLLYLSRVREYFADKFAAEHADPNALASALIKIAYGIIATPDESDLVRSTQQLGLVNEKQSKMSALVYHNGNIDWKKLGEVSLYDLYNPWAKFFEFFSTHPITGKRLEALMSYAQNPVISFKELRARNPLDKAKMSAMFWGDIKAFFVPAVLVIGSVVFIGKTLSQSADAFMILLGGGALIAYGVYIFALSYRKYGATNYTKKTIFELMKDPYASPFRGQAVIVDGEIIGKGMPGYVFSEDMVVQDDTGLLYVNYHGALGFLSNLWFSLTQVKTLIGKRVSADGWFLRNQKSMLVMQSITVSGSQEKMRAYSKFWAYAISLGIMVIGFILIFRGSTGIIT